MKASNAQEKSVENWDTEVLIPGLRGSRFDVRGRRSRPHKETSDVFSPIYRANTLLCLRFSADVILNTSSNIRLYTEFAMHLLGMLPNMTYLWY